MLYTAVCRSLDIYKEGILETTSLQQLGKESRNGYFVFKRPISLGLEFMSRIELPMIACC